LKNDRINSGPGLSLGFGTITPTAAIKHATVTLQMVLPSHPHQFVEHPKLDVGFILNLASTNLTSFYHFKDGKMNFQGSLKVDGGPRHMVTNKEGTFGWVSCMIQPVKIDKNRLES
jgi:hypothetical protein